MLRKWTADKDIALHDQDSGLTHPCWRVSFCPSAALIASVAATWLHGFGMNLVAPPRSCGSELPDVRMTGTEGYSRRQCRAKAKPSKIPGI